MKIKSNIIIEQTDNQNFFYLIKYKKFKIESVF